MTQESVEAAYRKKLASNPDGEITLDTVEIYHSQFSKRYRLVIDQVPLTAELETGEIVTFDPVTANVKNASNNADMSQTATFTFADPENTLDAELDLVDLTSDELPMLTFRSFILSDLTYPAWGPVEYEAQSVNQGKGKFTASVGAPKLNSNETGLILTPDVCPLIRGFMT